MTDIATIPLFPLHTVLYPDGLLPLRIFEPRYVDMISECFRSRSGFGIVPIRSGDETGSPALTFDTGTLATIVDWDQDADGLLGIVARGSRRFRVLKRFIKPNNLITGQVCWMQGVSDSELPRNYGYLAALLNEICMHDETRPRNSEYSGDSSLSIVHRLAELLPLSLDAKARLLECDDVLEKLDYLDRCVRQLQGQTG